MKTAEITFKNSVLKISILRGEGHLIDNFLSLSSTPGKQITMNDIEFIFVYKYQTPYRLLKHSEVKILNLCVRIVRFYEKRKKSELNCTS